ncbi:hypothetical protein SAMN05661010_02112 [Modicisalibacter muralis]|uniref:Diaminopimelate decarboxylase n=1 Tax=Modicisalibacter muralis TaxID=119000 RepID=A0A1G9LJ44_9GAMM|nr:type II toxin-antitoxin system RelE/ParE family toxin [Halomonas muralis]SDL61857.1 hypothetical protein SAMN05661010_02112 [Halomonas muralis]
MWSIEQTEIFEDWYYSLDGADRGNVLAAMLMFWEKRSMLPCPHADIVNGSRSPNRKELCTQSQGNPLRTFFMFDPQRTGVLLYARDRGGNDKRFYNEMIPIVGRVYAV